MKITIESTDRLVTLVVNGAEVPARIWEGASDGGVAVVAFITRVSPQTHDAEANAIFERELLLTRQPVHEPYSGAIDLRLIL